MKLFKMIDGVPGAEIKPGDSVTTFRDEQMTLTNFVAPHKPSSSGRVQLRDSDGKFHEYFPGVISAKIMEE